MNDTGTWTIYLIPSHMGIMWAGNFNNQQRPKRTRRTYVHISLLNDNQSISFVGPKPHFVRSDDPQSPHSKSKTILTTHTFTRDSTRLLVASNSIDI